MEEILASIRRIIADDEAKTAATAAAIEPYAPPAALTTDRPATVPPSPVEFVNDIPPAPEPLRDVRPSEAIAPDLDRAPLLTVQDEPTELPSLDEPEYFEREPEPLIDAETERLELGEVDDDPLENARRTLTAQMQQAVEQPLLSHSTSVAVDSAFASLAQTVLHQNARTLDDLVKEMLRPMLKAWLDDNLPSLVERLVRSEIERVSRGR